jgi:hypothetical protein
MAKVGFVVGNGRKRVPRKSILNPIDELSLPQLELMDRRRPETRAEPQGSAFGWGERIHAARRMSMSRHESVRLRQFATN